MNLLGIISCLMFISNALLNIGNYGCQMSLLEGSFHTGLGSIYIPQEFLLKFSKQDNNNNYFCDSR